MAMFYIKLTNLTDFPLEEGPISPNRQFKQSLDSPLSVTNITKMAMVYIKTDHSY